MKKLVYTLEGLGILAFCFLPSSMEGLSFLAGLLVIAAAFGVLLLGTKWVNKVSSK